MKTSKAVADVVEAERPGARIAEIARRDAISRRLLLKLVEPDAPRAAEAGPLAVCQSCGRRRQDRRTIMAIFLVLLAEPRQLRGENMVTLAARRTRKGVCFLALWSFCVVPPARSSKARSISGQGLAQDFPKPQL
jgi:hypothetical protein